eukprot:13928696-Alexandrium_andersonii.AAC.1
MAAFLCNQTPEVQQRATVILNSCDALPKLEENTTSLAPCSPGWLILRRARESQRGQSTDNVGTFGARPP